MTITLRSPDRVRLVLIADDDQEALREWAAKGYVAEAQPAAEVAQPVQDSTDLAATVVFDESVPESASVPEPPKPRKGRKS